MVALAPAFAMGAPPFLATDSLSAIGLTESSSQLLKKNSMKKNKARQHTFFFILANNYFRI
jgi:hypothetical protein